MHRETADHALRGPARVVIADDHEWARSELRQVLQCMPDVILVGEASNGCEALDLCRQLRPDLVLLDVRMPEMDGITTARAIAHEELGTRVLIMTAYDDPHSLVEALRARVGGFVLKDSSIRALIDAIRSVLHGRLSIDPQLAARSLRRLMMEEELS